MPMNWHTATCLPDSRGDRRMCLSNPGQVLEVQGQRALVRTRGRAIWCNALAQPDVQVDDCVLIHANLIIAVISREEAQRVQEAVAAVQGWADDPGVASGETRAAVPDRTAYT